MIQTGHPPAQVHTRAPHYHLLVYSMVYVVLLTRLYHSVRKVSALIIFFCENLVDFKEEPLHKTTLNPHFFPPVNSVSS